MASQVIPPSSRALPPMANTEPAAAQPSPASLSLSRQQWESLSGSLVDTDGMEASRAFGTKPVLKWMEDIQTFSPGFLRREANTMTTGTFARHKPSSLNAPDLVETYPTVFECGKDSLPPGAPVWDLDKCPPLPSNDLRPLPFRWAPRRLLLLEAIHDPKKWLEPQAPA